MTEYIENSKQFDQELENIFKETLRPLRLAYGVCDDDFLNFRFFKSTIDYISLQTISAYELPSLMRVLLSKECILPEEEINILYPNDEKEICYILEWGKRKSILIFSLKDATHFADHQFSKDLVNKRENILLLLNQVKGENE